MAAATLIVIWPLAVARPASAASDAVSPEILLFTLDGATLEALLATPGFDGLAHAGGAALLSVNMPGGATEDLHATMVRGLDLFDPLHEIDLGSVEAPDGTSSSAALCNGAADAVRQALDASTSDETLVLVASSSPPTTSEDAGDHLGALIMAQGPPGDLATAMRTVPAAPARTLTSDSTRRDGVVTSQDLARTVIVADGTQDLSHDLSGAEIRVVDAPPPVDLHARYVQSKRLVVPIGTAAALFVTFGGLIAVVALMWRRSPRILRSLMAWIAISSPFLALSLLLVGHLPSLTYSSVIPFVIATTALATIALVPIAHRWGTLGAIAAAGIMLLGALVIEGVLGWNAALTPLLGGSQLDGGRYFGLPNAFIGLLLGGSVYVAQRLPRAAGTALIAATGLFAGSPWTGSNIGAAVTLFAGAGIWWSLKSDRSWWRTAIAAMLAMLTGTGLVVVAHRYLTSAPTHITRFAEHTGGLSDVWGKIADRLAVGTHLIAANPFALVPVVGVLGTLVVVLRQPAPVRASFDAAPAWRTALLTILLGSVVAYLVNDSGAAAIGEGFTTALGGLLYVSLLRRNGIMETA